jgi:hypothetical protein
MTKNLGPGVSGWRDPEGRSWETTVFQASKPVVDAEINLIQDSEQDMELRLRRRSLPSGWLSDDYLDTSDAAGAIFSAVTVANELKIPPDLRAHVNGWLVRVNYTNANGASANILDLGAGPAGAGAKRTDLVVLEVWRRLLSAAPSTVGKSPAARVWWNGNVKIHAADDAALNFADDIQDALVGSETTKRVQIQYRLRVISDVHPLSYPYGIDDPTVVANSVPASAAAPDGVATAYGYVSQSSAGDPGLWRAGDGNPANTLGTVDGYMYAVPLMAVIRRNTAAFDKNSNHNGGVAYPGPSDRPDGLFYDIVDGRDVMDLRMGVSPDGWNYQEVLERNFNWLLDNQVQTEMTQTLIGGGVHGVTHLWADEIGITNAHGGDGVVTGDTPGAEFIGEFDAVRRRFSDRAIIETFVVKYLPAGANWVNNETITINPTALPIYPYSAFNWASYAPSGVAFVDVLRTVFLGVGGSKSKALLGPDANLTGLGAVPMTSMTLDIGTVPVGITNEPLYLTIAVMYPTGVGLTKTPTADYGAAGLVINNPAAMPVTAPVLFDSILNESLDYPHRELFLTYQTANQTISFSWGTGFNDVIHFPERVQSISSIVINTVPYAGSITLSDDGYSATLAGASFTTGEATVVFKAVRPFPQNGEQVTLYYEARAPQTVRDANLPTSITATPRSISQQLYAFVVGSGSQDEAYPFPYQYVQQPGVYPSSGGTFAGDHEFEGGGALLLENLTVNSGYIQLPVIMGYVPNPQEATFERVGGDIDSEGRSYYKEVAAGYIPSAYAQPLKVGGKERRVLLPVLAELRTDLTFGKKGQLVMLVLGTYYNSVYNQSSSNAVAFDPVLANNITSASVYRVKGNLLNRRSS